MKKFEDVFQDLNDFGRYQRWKIFLICLGSLIAPIATYLNIFIAPNPDHICKSPSPSELIELDLVEHGQCTALINGTAYQCEDWEFDKTYYKSTLTEEWSLVCEYSFLRAYIQTIFFSGVLFGSIILGKVSDSFGRRPAILIGIFFMVIGSIGSYIGIQVYFSFQVNYAIYVICGFLVAFGTRGLDEAGYVLALELVGPTKKAVSGIMIECFFALGHIILVVAAYFLRYWRDLRIFLFCFIFPFIIFFKLIPESPRWLASKNRDNEALIILNDIAKTNGTVLNKQSWEEYCQDSKQDSQEAQETFIKILKYPYFLLVLIYTICLWFVINTIFFGIGIKTNDLGIDPYLSFFVAGVLELVSCGLTFFFIDKCGRKSVFISCSIVIASCSMSIVFIENVPINLILAMAVKGAATISFSVLRVYSNEVFPTTIRVSCIGASSTISRIGVVIVPIINTYGDNYWKPLPFLMFAIIGLLSLIFSFLIPETMEQALSENLTDFDSIFNNKKKNSLTNLLIDTTDDDIKLLEFKKIASSQKLKFFA